MLELVKKGMLLGLGALDLTRDRVETLVDELIRRGELAQEKRKVAIDELLESVHRAQKGLMKRVKPMVERAIAELGLPTKADLQRLEERLSALEEKLGKQG